MSTDLGIASSHTRRMMWLISSLTALVLGAGAATAADSSQPNIVLIVADDLGWKDVGFHGSEIRTPNIDALAAAGSRLERHYVAPVCSPTRASLMTGRHSMRHGLQSGVVFPWADYGLPLNERTLPQALKQAGYVTWIIGKWHLGHHEPSYLPMARGFDHQYGFYNGAITYYTHEVKGGHDWHRDQTTVRETGYSTDLIGAEAVRAIDGHDRKQPLFLYVPFNAPHGPLQAPDDVIASYSTITDPKRRTFAAMVSSLDTQVGNIRAAIARAGLERDTLVIFFSDNGGPTEHGADNGGLRGGKGTLYEGGTRVVCCAAWPGHITAGVTISEPVSVCDWYPTLLRLAKAPLEQALPLDGADIWPCIADGAASPHRVQLYNVTPEGGAVRMGDWKLIVGRPAGAGMSEAPARTRSKNAKVPKPAGGTAPEDAVALFDLRADPNETTDLAPANSAKVSELRAALEVFAAQAVPPKYLPEPPGYRAPAVWE